jgi:hypothetical protein
VPDNFSYEKILDEKVVFDQFAEILQMSPEDLNRLNIIWKDHFISNLKRIKSKKCAFRINLLGGPLSEYWRATRSWWENIERHFPEILNRPVYFVSSNTHSIVNSLTGFALKNKEAIINFLDYEGNENLKEEWNQIINGNESASLENFLYYVLKKAKQTENGRYLKDLQYKDEISKGITRVVSTHYFDVDAQIIELNKLDLDELDPRIRKVPDIKILLQSDAIILNIDYPLGLAAYNILAKVAEHVNPILGVYIMGKAATLNGVHGDIMIPNVVHDEHSHNTYLFQNAFTASDLTDDLVYGTVLDNQKAITVLGTFLQNNKLAEVFYTEGYTDIEMEAGPYLSAIYEMYRPTRHPIDEIVNLYGLPFDVGIIHYASDTPLSKGLNLGAGTLSYFGMDSTYASTLAIFRRIVQLESLRIGKRNPSV